jgi:hypothetical protein
MIKAGRSFEGLAWLQTLPATVHSNILINLVEADIYVMNENWAALRTNLEIENWLDLDCLRLACRAVALKRLGFTGSAKNEWQAALKATGHRRYLLSQLLNMMGKWHCPDEQEDVLWAIATHYPDETLIMESLSDRLYIEGKTSSLMALYKIEVEHDSHDLISKNNLAMTALLLESWDVRPYELSREVYRAGPTNVDFASTYAYSLLLQRKSADSLKVMEKLTPDQLESPNAAAYYGIILKASGNASKARKYLDIAEKARLLPEEQNLIKKAKSQI